PLPAAPGPMSVPAPPPKQLPTVLAAVALLPPLAASPALPLPAPPPPPATSRRSLSVSPLVRTSLAPPPEPPKEELQPLAQVTTFVPPPLKPPGAVAVHWLLQAKFAPGEPTPPTRIFSTAPGMRATVAWTWPPLPPAPPNNPPKAAKLPPAGP